ncbi:hypothetical protein GCM10011354_21700 [Egicoccus halophilus]|uniref:Uncharacterized protein n=1 Tax=Egicoccus halophilus TaxID=1670830 RepID=A0A8J3A8Y6_9ACTN|nr:hypothetical protein GCM10011354_21700 [Egicoccus halophilus]
MAGAGMPGAGSVEVAVVEVLVIVVLLWASTCWSSHLLVVGVLRRGDAEWEGDAARAVRVHARPRRRPQPAGAGLPGG